MLGVSVMMGSTGDGADSAAAESMDGGGSGSEIGLVEEEKVAMRIDEVGGDRSSGGNRWPRQETLGLLKIRSEMDEAFRDSSLKGPLWEEVSRKLAGLGYHRSAKKCKEKFENVYKYHKRTKEGRAAKPEGKTYRFFDQLQALENQSPIAGAAMATTAGPPALHHPRPFAQPHPPTAVATPVTTMLAAGNNNAPTIIVPQVRSSTVTVSPINALTMTNSPANLAHSAAVVAGNFGSVSTSSSTSSDEDIERRRRRKRKWEVFFHRLMKEVLVKQEQMQKRFLGTLEKRERDRVAREEAWRVQEMARMNREHDLLVQERSIATAKDAAVIAFLQKVSDQHQIPNAAQIHIQIQTQPQPQDNNNNKSLPLVLPPLTQQPQPMQQPPLLLPPAPAIAPPTAAVTPPPAAKNSGDNPKADNGGENRTPANSSRWPKAEVQALIRLRTSLDLKYQESGPKGPLWEEISANMRKLGYNRNSKRCKEKWENINKYFKKVKECNKRRPEESKTCPYFHQLEAIYREKAKQETPIFNPSGFGSNNVPENQMVPIMVQPEQQWPLQPEQQRQDDHDSANGEQNHEDDNEEDEDDDDDDDEAGGYEIVTNKQPPSVGTVE